MSPQHCALALLPSLHLVKPIRAGQLMACRTAQSTVEFLFSMKNMKNSNASVWKHPLSKLS